MIFCHCLLFSLLRLNTLTVHGCRSYVIRTEMTFIFLQKFASKKHIKVKLLFRQNKGLVMISCATQKLVSWFESKWRYVFANILTEFGNNVVKEIS